MPFPKSIIVLDLETTGFDRKTDQIIEIGMIKLVNGRIEEQFESLVKPDKDIPDIVTLITGLKSEDFAEAPEIEELRRQIEDFILDYPICGHNVNFDADFLR